MSPLNKSQGCSSSTTNRPPGLKFSRTDLKHRIASSWVSRCAAVPSNISATSNPPSGFVIGASATSRMSPSTIRTFLGAVVAERRQLIHRVRSHRGVPVPAPPPASPRLRRRDAVPRRPRAELQRARHRPRRVHPHPSLSVARVSPRALSDELNLFVEITKSERDVVHLRFVVHASLRVDAVVARARPPSNAPSALDASRGGARDRDGARGARREHPRASARARRARRARVVARRARARTNGDGRARRRDAAIGARAASKRTTTTTTTTAATAMPSRRRTSARRSSRPRDARERTRAARRATLRRWARARSARWRSRQRRVDGDATTTGRRARVRRRKRSRGRRAPTLERLRLTRRARARRCEARAEAFWSEPLTITEARVVYHNYRGADFFSSGSRGGDVAGGWEPEKVHRDDEQGELRVRVRADEFSRASRSRHRPARFDDHGVHGGRVRRTLGTEIDW